MTTTASAPHVFLSYASADRDRVAPVVAALEHVGVHVWMDRSGIPGGTNYGPEIVTAIRDSAALLLCCSAEAYASRNVRQEVALAWKHERPIVPLLLEPTPIPAGLEYWLEATQWVEIGDRPEDAWQSDIARALARLGIAVRAPTPESIAAGTHAGAARSPMPLRPDVSALPRGTVTFLFTDIEGSTRLWEADRPAMERAIARQLDILRDAISAHGGTLFQVVGDAVQAAFPSAPQAVAAALDSQRALATEAWPVAAGSLPVRMALHAGEAQPDARGDYLAACLNRLARLLSTAHSGQVVLSQVVAELVRDQLPDGASLRDLGAHRLKDLLGPETVSQLVHPALPAEFPALQSLDVARHNLPIQLTPVIGRDREVAEIAALLRRGDLRLATLTGPGGTGKTRLGLQVAAEVVEDFSDGAWFVPLASISDPALVTSAIAEAVGVRETGSLPLPALLADYLRDKRLLIVLDNFEHLLDAAPVVAELLKAPGVMVLATSRAPLRLRGEHEVAVSPLGLPRRRPPPTADQLSQYAAVQLFIDRAQSVRADFAVDAANAPAIAEICHRLDGLPLAIELAAARVKILPPQAMLGRLEHRLPLLIGGARDLPDRQQTLRATIAWSYDLLSEDEQKLYRRLSVFAGGWTLEAAEAVAGSPMSGELALEVLEGLSRLVDHSLVHAAEGDKIDGEPRFGMLETIREYGLQQLATSSESTEAHERHAAHFADFAERADRGMRGPDMPVWLDRLETEHDNLRAALAWTADREPGTMARIATACAEFWLARGYWTEARSWLNHVLNAGDTISPATRVRSLIGAGLFARHQDSSRASALVEEALQLAREIEDKPGQVQAMGVLGRIAIDQGRHARAAEVAEQALALAREQGDDRAAYGLIVILGRAVAMQPDPVRARGLFEEAMTLMRATGDEWATSYVLGDLAMVLSLLGDLEGARVLAAQSVAAMRALGEQWRVASDLSLLGGVMFQLGDLDEATALIEESLELAHVLGSPWLTPGNEGLLGKIALARGDLPGARTLMEASLAGTKSMGDDFMISWALTGMGDLARAENDLGGAMTFYGQAIDLAWKAREAMSVAAGLRALAVLLSQVNRLHETARLFGAAEAVRAAHGCSFRGMESPSREPDLTAVRERLGASAFQEDFEVGTALSLDEVVAEARALVSGLASDRVDVRPSGVGPRTSNS